MVLISGSLAESEVSTFLGKGNEDEGRWYSISSSDAVHSDSINPAYQEDLTIFCVDLKKDSRATAIIDL